MNRRLVLIVLIVALAVAFLPALASDGCGGIKVVSAGCGASGVLTAICLPLVVLALRRILRPARIATLITPAYAQAGVSQRAPPKVEVPLPTPAPLRL